MITIFTREGTATPDGTIYNDVNFRDVQEYGFSIETKYNPISNSYYKKISVTLDTNIIVLDTEYVIVKDKEYKIVGINEYEPLSIGKTLKDLMLEG